MAAGLAAVALGSTASAAVRPGDSVVAPTSTASSAIAGARLGSPVDSSEELRGGILAVIAFLIAAGLLILVTDSESP
ncbi:MAG TPA: hypothetical protein VI168_09885 [Croceibacterium sp.]